MRYHEISHLIDRIIIQFTSTKFVAFVVGSIFCYKKIIDTDMWFQIVAVYMSVNQFQKFVLPFFKKKINGGK